MNQDARRVFAAGRIVAALVLSLAVVQAAEPRHEPHRTGASKKRWIASWVALAAINALDIHSSRGQGEAHPLYRNAAGRFDARKAALLKSGITGGFFALQLTLLRSHPEKDYYPAFTVANTVAAGGMGAVVVHNYSLPAPRPQPSVPAHLAPQ